jgi:hypothetical protein
MVAGGWLKPKEFAPVMKATLSGARLWLALTCVLTPASFLATRANTTSSAQAAEVMSNHVTAPALQTRDPANVAMARIDAALGQLQAADEASLRQPLLGMHRAELGFQASPDPRFERQLSWWAERFSLRLATLKIPEGTRAALVLRLAAYQRGALETMGKTLAARPDIATHRYFVDTSAG